MTSMGPIDRRNDAFCCMKLFKLLGTLTIPRNKGLGTGRMGRIRPCAHCAGISFKKVGAGD